MADGPILDPHDWAARAAKTAMEDYLVSVRVSQVEIRNCVTERDAIYLLRRKCADAIERDDLDIGEPWVRWNRARQGQE